MQCVEVNVQTVVIMMKNSMKETDEKLFNIYIVFVYIISVSVLTAHTRYSRFSLKLSKIYFPSI